MPAKRYGSGAKRACLAREIGIVAAVTALLVALAGYLSDTRAAAVSRTAKKPNGHAQLRYYGGPKSPMWRSQ